MLCILVLGLLLTWFGNTSAKRCRSDICGVRKKPCGAMLPSFDVCPKLVYGFVAETDTIIEIDQASSSGQMQITYDGKGWRNNKGYLVVKTGLPTQSAFGGKVYVMGYTPLYNSNCASVQIQTDSASCMNLYAAGQRNHVPAPPGSTQGVVGMNMNVKDNALCKSCVCKTWRKTGNMGLQCASLYGPL